jgi:hypothetical protein
LTSRSVGIAAALLLVTAACDGSSPATPLPPDGPLAITLESLRPAYDGPSGGSVRATNETGSDVFYGGCPARLERLVTGRWESVPPLDHPCPAVINVLPAGQSRDVSFDLRAAPASGTYRVAQRFWLSDADANDASVRRSNSFIVAVDR